MLKANLLNSRHYEGNDLEKLNRSLALLEQTINGDQFKVGVLNFNSFEFTIHKCGFIGLFKRTIELHHYSNVEVYEKLMKGHRQEGADSFMDLNLVLSDSGGGKAIGETDGNDVTTTYRAAFDKMMEGPLAAHITHEWTHTLGFQHSFSRDCDAKRDCYSVPYAIGNLVELILTGNCRYGCQYKSLANAK